MCLLCSTSRRSCLNHVHLLLSMCEMHDVRLCRTAAYSTIPPLFSFSCISQIPSSADSRRRVDVMGLGDVNEHLAVRGGGFGVCLCGGRGGSYVKCDLRASFAVCLLFRHGSYTGVCVLCSEYVSPRLCPTSQRCQPLPALCVTRLLLLFRTI